VAWSYRLDELAAADPDWPEGSLTTPDGDVLVPAWWFAEQTRPDGDVVLAQALLPIVPGAPPFAAPVPPEVAAGMARALERGFEAIGRAMVGIAGEIHEMVVFRDNRAFRATLNEAMRVSGVEATEPWHAHHLVPIGGAQGIFRDPTPAQQGMAAVGLHLNSLENGMVLPARFHRWLHGPGEGERYYAFVNGMMATVRTQADAEMGLIAIRTYIRERYAVFLSQTPPPHPSLPPWP
jgi:hypothetical protein